MRNALAFGQPRRTNHKLSRNPRKDVGKPRVKTMTMRRDTRLVTGNIPGVSTPHTLDKAIRNCIRAMDNPDHPHFRFWNQDKLDILLAVQKGELPHARIR